MSAVRRQNSMFNRRVQLTSLGSRAFWICYPAVAGASMFPFPRGADPLLDRVPIRRPFET
jgi:hypothetical protein